jgi:hypothetical protein
MLGSTRDFPEPIFVGGVGRSGTHPMARLIEADPRYHRIRTEVRFHAAGGGLSDLCEGRTDMRAFKRRMGGHWFRRGANQRQGLQRLVDRDELEAALADFEAAFASDRIAASRDLVRRLCDPAAARAGKPAWVELTGQSLEQAPFLLRLFPRAKFVNMVRDGRAVVAGTLKKHDLTDDPMRALKKWEDMVRAADAAIRAVPAERVLTVHLDDFTAHDRAGTFARLVDFLEIDDRGPMEEYFEREITGQRAHVDAWRERMAPADARKVDRRYRRLVRKLRRRGVAWAPQPR